MIDHLVINVEDLAASKAFYRKALAPMGYGVIMEFPEGVGFGKDEKPSFWIAKRGESQTGIHIAFVADDRASVDAFYTASMEAGAKDNGKPGVRPEYHPTYYGAFVFDLDGNNIEAVCHKPPAE